MGLIQLCFNGNRPAALIYQLLFFVEVYNVTSLTKSQCSRRRSNDITCLTDITLVGVRAVPSVIQILVNWGPVSILYISTRLQCILVYLLVNSILKIIVHLLMFFNDHYCLFHWCKASSKKRQHIRLQRPFHFHCSIGTLFHSDQTHTGKFTYSSLRQISIHSPLPIHQLGHHPYYQVASHSNSQPIFPSCMQNDITAVIFCPISIIKKVYYSY